MPACAALGKQLMRRIRAPAAIAVQGLVQRVMMFQDPEVCVQAPLATAEVMMKADLTCEQCEGVFTLK